MSDYVPRQRHRQLLFLSSCREQIAPTVAPVTRLGVSPGGNDAEGAAALDTWSSPEWRTLIFFGNTGGPSLSRSVFAASLYVIGRARTCRTRDDIISATP